MTNFGLALLFSIMFGIATLLSFAALAGKIKFSLRTIFVIVTTSCFGFALFAALGDEVVYLFVPAIGVVLPLANLVAIGATVVSLLHSEGSKQAVRIGWLLPLVAMAIIDCQRFANYQFVNAYSLIYPLIYLTAGIAGVVCERTYYRHSYRSTQHPLTGAYRGDLVRHPKKQDFSGRHPLDLGKPDLGRTENVVGSSHTNTRSANLEDEPNIYEIG